MAASLAPYNTFGLATTCQHLLSLRSLQDLAPLEKALSGTHFILGGGSNVLFYNHFPGTVVLNRLLGKTIVEETPEEVLLEAQGGENWHALVMLCLRRGWYGLENLSFIPGTVGAAPIQNIGAYGVEQNRFFHSLRALNLQTLKEETFGPEDCRFGYRDSFFKQEGKGRYLITAVRYRLLKHPKPKTHYGAIRNTLESWGIENPGPKDVSRAVIYIRRSKLPNPDLLGNSGSFFKNPVISQEQFEALQARYPQIPHYPAGQAVKVPAGWLIDQQGWKGYRQGPVGVHKNQALILVHYGGGSGKQLMGLAERIRQSVWEAYGLWLEREVNLVKDGQVL